MLVSGTLLLEPHNHLQPEWPGPEPIAFLMREICLLFFFNFYRKGLIGVWYCNLRNTVKATTLGHPRHTEARPQYKASNIYQPEDWKMQVPSRKNKTLRFLSFS
jgi:hypothetical protein